MSKIRLLMCMIIATSLMGCAFNHEAISNAITGSRQDVFQVVSESPAGSGEALLNIDFSVKINPSLFGSITKESFPTYRIVVNIDGQALELTDKPVLEDLPGIRKYNPEIGTGWRFHFMKSLSLMPGKHRITIAVPLSDVIVGKDVVVVSGNNTLELIPIYYTELSRYSKSPWFQMGLRTVSLKLNSGVL